ncbi:hypothetical protein GGF32_007296 [Allomyces javanicus]|nr:hypothetical protein GGF32_007296 [Allomyces javanicus]
MVSGSNLDVLVNLATLTLPPLVEWHVELTASLISDQDDVDQQPPSILRSLPAACAPTLERITGQFSMHLVELLSCMPRLYRIDEAPVVLGEDDAPRAEWRLEYVQGNALWTIIPSMDLHENRGEWEKMVRKLVVEVRQVEDFERMTQEITNMARWCVECRPWVGDNHAVRARECQRDPFPLEVRVPVGVVEAEVLEHIKAMIQALAADGIVGQVVAAD